MVRAWKAVDATVAEQTEKIPPARRAHLWRPLQKLMEKARAAREREVAIDENLATPAGQSKVEESERSPDPFTSSDYGALDKNGKRQNPSANRLDSEPSGPGRARTGETSRTGTTDSYATAFTSSDNQDVHEADENCSENDPTLDGTDFGWPLTNEASMPDLHPTASRTMFDVADNDDFAASPFFVNQPPSDPTQWTDCQNVELLNDFIGGDVGPMKNNSYMVPGNPQQIYQSHAQTGVPTQPSQTFGSYSSQPTQQEAQQQAQQRFSNIHGMPNGIDHNLPNAPPSNDSIITGTDEPMLSWEAWDDMVRNLEMETTASGQFQQQQPLGSQSGVNGPSMYGGYPPAPMGN